VDTLTDEVGKTFDSVNTSAAFVTVLSAPLVPGIDIQAKSGGDNTPDSIDGTDFGSVLVGKDSKTREFTIPNMGTGDPESSGTPGVQVSGTHANDFSVIQPSSQVSSDEPTTFRIEFTPGAEGLRTASISITSNEGNEKLYDFVIQGTGQIEPAPEITILGNDITIADGDNTPDAGDGTDFGSVLLGIDSKTREFTIWNSGTADLELTGTPTVQISGTHAEDFSVTLPPSSPISPYGSTTFRIEFTPGAEGSRTASIRIASNDGNADPYDFSIQGAGEIPAPEITILGNGTTIADGDNTPDADDGTDLGIVDVDVGSKTRTFTIQNLGTSDLELDGMPLVDITGPHADSFSVTVEPSLSVDPNNRTSFAIDFNPDESGVFTATITIANNDENEDPYNFDIRGTGLKKPERPSLISPEDLKKIEVFEPVLIASGFSDRDQGDTQRASQWQIFLTGQIEEGPPIYDLTIGPEQRETDPNTSFTKVQILWGILKPSTSYQWRVRYQDFMGPWWSEWSDLSTFTTPDSDPEHHKQQVDPPSGFKEPDMKGTVRGAISCENTKNATVIFACEKERILVKSVNPENLPAKGRPGDFPIGVFSFRIEALSPGESISISFYIPGNYEGGKWWKFDLQSGWHEHKNATFTYKPVMGYTLVEVTVRDGAEGDCDFVSNGIIVDPGGPVPPRH
ncbi:MAG: choice-of-anchor D domain-containing protein, partial [bacterium]